MGSDCIFCRIVAGDIPAKIVRRAADVVAFDDLNPQAPTHVLVIPTEHVERAIHLEPRHGATLARMFGVAAEVARERKIEDGYRVVVNNGPGSGQSVYHLHMHVLGGRPMTWPPG